MYSDDHPKFSIEHKLECFILEVIAYSEHTYFDPHRTSLNLSIQKAQLTLEYETKIENVYDLILLFKGTIELLAEHNRNTDNSYYGYHFTRAVTYLLSRFINAFKKSDT
jgi:hypothetical protein